MSCLDNIVVIGNCDDDIENPKAFRLIDAPGISSETLAKIADVNTHTGVKLAIAKRNLAINKVRSAFLTVMAENTMWADISRPIYPSGNISTTSNGLFNGYRGVVVHPASPNDAIKKVGIESISFIPLMSGSMNLRIEQNGTAVTHSVAVTGNALNTISGADINNGEPLLINTDTKFLLDTTNIPLMSSDITCMKGCGGTLPNTCLWVDGFNGTKAVKSDGFGLVVSAKCECDYDEVLCYLSETLIGDIIYTQWQIEIFQEQAFTSRFNNIVVYSKEDILEEMLPTLKHELSSKWKAVIKNLPSLIGRFKTDCIKCKHSRWVSNL